VLPLYIRENSIIPMGADMQYVGEKPLNPILLNIWLSSEAKFTLYDDDERAHTEEIVECRASKQGNRITLNVGESGKRFYAKFNKTSRPKQVTLDGKEIPHRGSREALEKAEKGWYFEPFPVVYAKLDPSGNAKELVLHL
jgi:alpha-glucosidase (family GH31 glycosyl hydrolase)